MREVETLGTVSYDETTLVDVTTRAPGWVQKLYADSTGLLVHAGDRLCEFYSPELLSAQAEFVATIDGPTAGGLSREDVANGAIQKLRLLGISEDQIRNLLRTRRPQYTVRIDAPRAGWIIEKKVVEGTKVEAGELLFRIADLSTVWVLAHVFEADLPFVRVGQEAVAVVDTYPDKRFRGRITYLYPSIDEKSRTAMVRLEFHNPGYYLRPGMFARVFLRALLKQDAILVPDSAVLRSGKRATVFVVRGNGKFLPRQVILGHRTSSGQYEVLHGVTPGEEVVTSAQFLLDSESRLREVIQKLLAPSSPTRKDENEEEFDSEQWGLSASESRKMTPTTTHTAYVCPMPEHMSIVYDKPGSCPICGMDLVTVAADHLIPAEMTSKILHYTCPMPEHSDIHLSTPGKCSRCGMTLVPIWDNSALNEASTSAPTHLHVGSSPTTSPRGQDSLVARDFTCEMHPDIQSSAPGNCPICRMKLVPRANLGTLSTHASEGGGQSSPASPSSSPARKQKFFTCGMHPQVISPKLGNCPICGMKLVEKWVDAPGSPPAAPVNKHVPSGPTPAHDERSDPANAGQARPKEAVRH